MKTRSEDYRSLCSIINLRSAWERVEESDGCAGVDGVTLERFSDNLESELERLRSELLSQTYAPLPLLRFMAPKAGGGERPISVPVVRDRVAQHAAISVIGPAFEAEFEKCSFAYRRGRSVQQALDQVERLREDGYVWVVDADIVSYFDNVDHELMLGSVRELVADDRLVELIESWIKAQVYDGRQITKLEKGLPQGAPISPMLANLYLDRFDEQMLAEGQKLIRFADDFLVLCKTKPKAEAAMRMTSRLLQQLRLALNPEKTRITSFTEGFKFLGSTFVRSLRLTPLPGSRKNPERNVDIIIPPPLPILRLSENPYRQFNTALKDGLRDALVEIDGRQVPDFYRGRIRKDPVIEPEQSINMDKPQIAHSRPFAPESEVPMNDQTNEPIPADQAEDFDSGTPSMVTLRTLYLQDHGIVLRCEDDHLRITKDDDELLNLPSFKIDQILLMGNGMITTPAMKFCLRNNISIVLLSGSGQFEGIIESPGNQNVLLQKRQYELSSDENFAVAMARRYVTGKIANYRALLQRRHRSASDDRLERAIAALQGIREDLQIAESLDQIRGYEGAGSAEYFKGLASCFQGPFTWQGRARRPPPDPLNAMLSFGYTMLFQNIYAIVRARGLSPYVGLLHELRQGHPALCSDLIEEFRAPIVDALVTTVVNKRIITPADFHIPLDTEERGCFLTAQGRRTFIEQFEGKMSGRVKHPHFGIKTTWRGIIDLQIGRYVRALWEGADHYQPFEIR